ncbi:protein-disulfide reductase DsbD family protein [Planctomycetes bacterium K23_9]|uniref:Thiol:disulfide interchange protein DsbD n=1 Tax=Stieleria marina TaxID=1930275 RepID=A0A517NVQ6_9BACT|nr:Thiol:disulfide interchange protein DsbD precursor [Planctomycetes bacterium K23_9]
MQDILMPANNETRQPSVGSSSRVFGRTKSTSAKSARRTIRPSVFAIKFVVALLVTLVGLPLAAPQLSLAPAMAQGGFKLPMSVRSLGIQNEDPATWSATYRVVPGTDEGVLEVEVVLSQGWHVFSTTQESGGPIPTSITIAAPKAVQLSGAFQPDHEPESAESDVFEGVTIEEFHDSVIWSAKIVLPPGYQGDIEVAVDGQTCSEAGSCTPVQESLVAKYTGEAKPVQTVADTATAKVTKLDLAKAKPYREPKNPVQWKAAASKSIAAGDRGVLQFNATLDPEYHVYTAAVDDANSSTNFIVTNKSGLKVGMPTTPTKIIVDNTLPTLPMKYHDGDVTWSLPVQVPAGTAAGEHKIEGFIVYQACTKSACYPPTALKFETVIVVGDGAAGSTVVSMKPAKRPVALDAADGNKWVDELDAAGNAPAAGNQSQSDASTSQAPPINPSTPDQVSAAESPPSPDSSGSNSKADSRIADSASAASAISSVVVKDSPEEIAEMAKLYNVDEKIRYLTLSDMDSNPIGSGGVSSSDTMTFWSALFGAFVGGIILNLMPCVFPVLGLKVMGFVKQAGNDPAKIRMHGIAFAGGLLVAMWVLAGIILTIKISLGTNINWGAQMSEPYFVCAMIVLLFLLGLNLAGVFEFGTSMTRVGGSIQGKEGYSSSFLSGVLTTLVATPCSGPFLGAAMSYTLAQPAGIAMILFTVFGLGIAVPYLLLCFFPALINRLPRPGAWMETFKVTMAFALFATVAFFMQAFGSQTGASGLSWLAMALVVIALAAYYYGNYSAPHVPDGKRWAFGYIMPLAIFSLGAWMCYGAANERSTAESSYHAGGLAWQDWNPGKVEQTLRRKKKTVWVDYTADW